MFIKDYMDIYPVEKMAVVLKISSSGFYKWLNIPLSQRGIKTLRLSDQIKAEYHKSNQIYGSPRITQELNKSAHKVSRSYVARLMKKVGIEK